MNWNRLARSSGLVRPLEAPATFFGGVKPLDQTVGLHRALKAATFGHWSHWMVLLSFQRPLYTARFDHYIPSAAPYRYVPPLHYIGCSIPLRPTDGVIRWFCRFSSGHSMPWGSTAVFSRLALAASFDRCIPFVYQIYLFISLTSIFSPLMHTPLQTPTKT